MPKKVTIPESPLENEPWPPTHEEGLAELLRMAEAKFRADPTNALPAFEALAYVVTQFWRTSDAPPDNVVHLPWWVAETLVMGFQLYIDSMMNSPPITLGEAYNLEGRGQGKESKVAKSLRDLRDMRITTKIAILEEDGIKIEAALQQLSDETGLSCGQVRRIWQAHKTHARESLRNLRTRASS